MITLNAQDKTKLEAALARAEAADLKLTVLYQSTAGAHYVVDSDHSRHQVYIWLEGDQGCLRVRLHRPRRAQPDLPVRCRSAKGFSREAGSREGGSGPGRYARLQWLLEAELPYLLPTGPGW
jgi:hypothetical protein